MRRSRTVAFLLLGVAAFALAGGCASEAELTETRQPTDLALTGPGDWEVSILQHPPPYGLIQYLERPLPGVPPESRGLFIVGKAWKREGRGVVARLCNAQWSKEMAAPIQLTGRVPLRVRRGGADYEGWEARRMLPDGTPMRLRALCGSSDVKTAFIFMSAPDKSSLYEPVWERLLLLNLGSADNP